ncbi:hypothetical protein [Rossellomorea marisflavi]|uniref:hypothetical protein n=1 Tax=Rossellomorea marisflavi TaxID=189381 RepID=UPI0034584B69
MVIRMWAVTSEILQSEMKRRELDSSGKACRKALAGSAKRPANTHSVEKLIKP